MRSTTDPHPVRWMRDVEVLLWTSRRGRGSGWVADGAGCGVSSQIFTASVYEWVGGWDGSGEPWLRDVLVRNVG